MDIFYGRFIESETNIQVNENINSVANIQDLEEQK